MLETLRARARLDQGNERADVNEPCLVPAYRIEQKPGSSLCVRNRIPAGLAHRRENVKRIRGGGINHQIMAGHPFVKLPSGLAISR